MINYNPSTSMMGFYLGAVALDIAVVPLILMRCWNVVIPQTFDSVHEIDYKAALLIRLTLYALTCIFGNSAHQADYDMRYEHYLNIICNSIKKEPIKTKPFECNMV